jgi:hypothetical protein
MYQDLCSMLAEVLCDASADAGLGLRHEHGAVWASIRSDLGLDLLRDDRDAQRVAIHNGYAHDLVAEEVWADLGLVCVLIRI